MSYSIDVYQNKFKPEKNFLNFMTYVTMFPQLVAGPIVRFEQIKDDLKQRNISFNSICDGFYTFSVGLIKKVILANNLGLLFNIIFKNLAHASILSSWLCLLCYTLQIYFDFSGYSDMAIGLGKMMGFNYPKNFNYPYISKSITEFWTRWHMTLSAWFKSYVYISLGGNRCSNIRNIFNILIVWLLTGIWHGASWNFVIWGLYFALVLIVEKYLLKNVLAKLPNIIKHLYSIVIIMLSWAIFCVNNLGEYKLFMTKLFKNKLIVDRYFFLYLQNYFVFVIIGIIAATPIIKTKLMNNKIVKLIYYSIIFILFIISISFLVGDSYNPFLYFRF